jgi:hypothetical protein
MKATAATDPAFFLADYAYYQELDQVTQRAAGWKKVLGRIFYWIAVKWWIGRLAPR